MAPARSSQSAGEYGCPAFDIERAARETGAARRPPTNQGASVPAPEVDTPAMKKTIMPTSGQRQRRRPPRRRKRQQRGRVRELTGVRADAIGGNPRPPTGFRGRRWRMEGCGYDEGGRHRWILTLFRKRPVWRATVARDSLTLAASCASRVATRSVGDSVGAWVRREAPGDAGGAGPSADSLMSDNRHLRTTAEYVKYVSGDSAVSGSVAPSGARLTDAAVAPIRSSTSWHGSAVAVCAVPIAVVTVDEGNRHLCKGARRTRPAGRFQDVCVLDSFPLRARRHPDSRHPASDPRSESWPWHVPVDLRFYAGVGCNFGHARRSGTLLRDRS